MFQNTRVTSMETGKIKMENSYEDVDIKDEPLEPDVDYHVSYILVRAYHLLFVCKILPFCTASMVFQIISTKHVYFNNKIKSFENFIVLHLLRKYNSL